MNSDGDEATTTVRAMLGAAGITVPPEDLGSLARVLPSIQRRIDRMYDIYVGDEVTAAVFSADDGVER